MLIGFIGDLHGRVFHAIAGNLKPVTEDWLADFATPFNFDHWFDSYHAAC